jgi:hypothetical protein
MMEEEVQSWRARYRRTLTDEPIAALDEVILRAASRHATRVRTVRRSALLLVLAAVVMWPYWSKKEIHAPRASQESGFGREEGATRYYLLNVAAVPYTGPGALEQTP